MRLLACLIVLCASSAQAFQTAAPDLAAQAQKELYAARNDYAAILYQKLIDQEPARGEAYYGLVRALLRAHKSHDAYTAAALGLEKAPQTAGAQVAAGMAAFRRGELAQAEQYYRAAYKIDPKNAGALASMASLFSMRSKFRTARDLMLEAYRYSPDDPTLMLARANSLKGAEHISALEKVLGIYDPESGEARALRANIERERAFGDRRLSRLTSPYERADIKLFQIMDSPKVFRGMGVRVRLNDRQTVRLLLDVGLSGIELSPKIAEKSGLEVLEHESYEKLGIGDGHSLGSLQYLASKVSIGDAVTFENCPVAVYPGAETADYDGSIGAGIFRRFLVTIDFLTGDLTLEPHPKIESTSSGEPEDADNMPAAGFNRVSRLDDDLAVLTSVNQQPPKLFLLDSAAQTNVVDEDVVQSSGVGTRYSSLVISGDQGRVKKVSTVERVSLSFAGIRYDAPKLIAINFDKISDKAGVQVAGILGLQALGHLKLTIDYRNGAVRFDHR